MKLGSLAYRAAGASFLDGGTYEGVEHDRSATGQAAIVVLLSSLAAGIGASRWYGPSLAVVLACAAVALVTWVAWAVLTLQIGTRILPGRETESNLGELLRTVGFAAAPGLLQGFGAFPGMAIPVFVTAWTWMFLAMVVGVKHALDYPTMGRALLVCGLAASLIAVVAFGLGLMLGPTVQ